MKTILITGGAGFIGSHLCEALIGEAQVICMDDLSTGSVENIQHLLQHPHFEFLNHDISQPFILSDFSELKRFSISLNGLQEIYHLACPVSKQHFEDYKIASLVTNSIGTKNVMDLAVAYKARVVFASSSALYGVRQSEHTYADEEAVSCMNHLTLAGAYDEGKRFSESLLYTYGELYHLSVRIVRLFRTYGPRMKMRDGYLLPEIVEAALENNEIMIPCDAETKIALCHVRDVINGLIKIMRTDNVPTVINIGSDHSVSMQTLVNLIVHFADSLSQPHFEIGRDLNEAPLPNLQRARDFLQWIPLMALEQGIESFVEETKSRRKRLAFGKSI